MTASAASRIMPTTPQPLGAFEHHQDVGAAAPGGTPPYDPLAQSYTFTAAGARKKVAGALPGAFAGGGM